MTPSHPLPSEPDLAALLRWFGHEYDVARRQEWHSLNCTYRKTWPMGGEDEPGCIAARAALASANPEPELCPDCTGTGYVRHSGDLHFRAVPPAPREPA